MVGELGFPLVVRPSYVLGGRAMQIIREEAQLGDYLLGTLPELVPSEVKARYPNDKTGQINTLLGKNPLLFDRYLSDAIEVDVDALADGKDVFVCGIMEHIEEAGIHSGDSACSLPPHSLGASTIARTRTPDQGAGAGAGGQGPDERPVRDQGRRHLRARGQSARLADGAVRRQDRRRALRQDRRAGDGRQAAGRSSISSRTASSHVAVKEAVFPFARFPNVDTLLGPEMRSTGEAMGLDRDFAIAFAKSQLGAGGLVPTSGTVFVSVRDSDKPLILDAIRRLERLGFKIVATSGTQRYLAAEGVACAKINKVLEGRPHIVDAIKNGGIQLVFNTTEGAHALSDSRSLRRAALLHRVPYYTTVAGSVAASLGIEAYSHGELEVRPLQSYFGKAA